MDERSQPLVRARWLLALAMTIVFAGFVGLRSGVAAEPSLDVTWIDANVQGAMAQTTTTGLSVAIAYRGRLVFAKGYGFADVDSGERMRTTHRLRLASISKTMTAIEIMRLIERGRLRLDQRVFGGRDSVLGDALGPVSRFRDPRVDDITVRHLLEHTAGGWDNTPGDGSYDPVTLRPELGRDAQLAWVLRTIPLDRAPGTAYDYSNFGFALLGRIVEHVTGRPYADVMRDEVFTPAGATSFAVGGPTRAERLADEVTYTQVGDRTDAPYTRHLDPVGAYGGWVATPTDLVRVVLQADGFPSVPDRLGPEALAMMTTRTEALTPEGAAPFSAKGWFVNDVPNWWHAGLLAGTSSLVVRTADELTLAFVTNANHGVGDRRGELDLDELVGRIVRGVSAWPAGEPF